MQFCSNLSDTQLIIPNVKRIKISLFLGQCVSGVEPALGRSVHVVHVVFTFCFL